MSYVFPLFVVLLLGQGCTADPGTLTNGSTLPPSDREASDPSANDGPAPAPVQTSPTTTPTDDSFGTKTLTRAREWITASMPYCGGPNGGEDVICGGTCERTGTAKSPEWDAYRSDCSGFVSWSWGLDAPGETTRTLAPYDTSVSSLITVDDLQPGDALNGSGHVMLFGGWVDKASGQATILQESRCGTDAGEKISTFTVIDDTTLEISDGRDFRTIRYKNAGGAGN